MRTPPRILVCTFQVLPSPTGASRRLTEHLRALTAAFEVDVLSLKTSEHRHIERYHGARLLRVPVGDGGLAARVQAFDRAVRRQIASEEYAAVHFTDPFGGVALCELKREAGFKAVYEALTLPSLEPPHASDPVLRPRLSQQEGCCLGSADRVITGSATTGALLEARGARNIHVLRAPVDLSGYAPRARTGPAGALRVLFLGSAAEHHDLETVLAALALANREVDVRLTLVGPIDPAVERRDPTAKVEVRGPLEPEELARLVPQLDAGLVPLADLERNRLQGSPLAVLSDYLAGGLPVVAADLPVTRELVPPSAGVFYSAGDAAALSARLVELASDVDLRASLQEAAKRERVAVSTAGVEQALLRIYEELLGGPFSRPGSSATGSTTGRMTPDEQWTVLASEPMADDERTVTALSPGLGPGDRSPDQEPPEAAEPAGVDPWLAQLTYGFCPPGVVVEPRPPPAHDRPVRAG